MGGATDDEHAGKRLDVRDRLQYAMATIAVLRSLALTDRTMQYSQLAQAIGLIPPAGTWKAWHRQQIAEILQIVAAVEAAGRTEHQGGAGRLRADRREGRQTRRRRRLRHAHRVHAAAIGGLSRDSL